MSKKEKIEVIAITVNSGIVKIADEYGRIMDYAQRGLKSLRPDEATVAIERGLLNPIALNLPMLPLHYKISFEDPKIQGKAQATFNKKVLYDN